MSFFTRGTFGWVIVFGGAAYWALALTLLQPGTEHGDFAQNNSYWVRDLRWTAIVAVVIVVIALVRGDRVRSAAALLGGAAWIGLDLLLDRLDVAGIGAAIGLTIAAVLVVGAARWFAVRCLDETAAPGRVVLVLAAAVAAALTPLAGGIESPTDSELALTPSALVVSALLLLAGLGAGLTAARPGRHTQLLTTAIAITGILGLVVLRVLDPAPRLLPAAVLGVALLVGIVLLVAWPSDGRLTGWLFLALAATVTFPVVAHIAIMLDAFALPATDMFTALAGSPPVNGADEDLLRTMDGIATGLLLGIPAALAAAMRPKPTT